MPVAYRRAFSLTASFSVASLVLLLEASDAHAFCRTTTQPLPASYSPTKCFTDGLFLYWRGACVSYSINQAASRNVPFDDAKRIIDESFARWMNVQCADTGEAPGIAVSNAGKAECDQVIYNPESANQNLIVFRDDGWPYSDPNSTLGLTTVTFNAETGEIFDADMEINASGRNLSITDQVPANGFDLASVITHEAGHFFGLAHATDSKSTMFASYKPGTIALRTLTADDSEGICAIYPTTATRIVSTAASPTGKLDATACDPNPRHGLTAKCTEPASSSGGKCEVAPTRASSSSGTSSWLAALGALGLIAALRRRVTRRA